MILRTRGPVDPTRLAIGEPTHERFNVCSMVPVPDEADEDARRCVRERTELISERIGLTNRIGAVLATLGVSDYNPLLRNRCRRLAELRTGLGEPLPANAHAKIKRLLARLEKSDAKCSLRWRDRNFAYSRTCRSPVFPWTLRLIRKTSTILLAPSF
jgi:hypothetical protein